MKSALVDKSGGEARDMVKSASDRNGVEVLRRVHVLFV